MSTGSFVNIPEDSQLPCKPMDPNRCCVDGNWNRTLSFKIQRSFNPSLAPIRTPEYTFIISLIYLSILRMRKLSLEIIRQPDTKVWQSWDSNLSLPYSIVHYFSLPSLPWYLKHMEQIKDPVSRSGAHTVIRSKKPVKVQGQNWASRPRQREKGRRPWMPSLRAYSSTTILLPPDEV